MRNHTLKLRIFEAELDFLYSYKKKRVEHIHVSGTSILKTVATRKLEGVGREWEEQKFNIR